MSQLRDVATEAAARLPDGAVGMSAAVTKSDIEYAFARLGTAVDAAITLAGRDFPAPQTAELARQAGSLLLFARIGGWAAAEETLSAMHFQRKRAKADEEARGGQRSAVNTLIDEEIEVSLAIVREGRKQQREAAARAGLIDDEAGD